MAGVADEKRSEEDKEEGGGDNVAAGDEDEEEEDELSVVEQSSDEDGQDPDTNEHLATLANASNQGRMSVVERSSDHEVQEEEMELGAHSQVPRGFFERMFWNESDVRFTNNTDREVLFIIADEEFILQRTNEMTASLNNCEDDDESNKLMENPSLNNLASCFGLSFVPLKAQLSASTSTIVTKQALKTRCMPVAPKSHSTQHFQSERLTYVTAMTKDVDGEGQPWTRVHYENKVINCQRTKSLRFARKHLKISAYRIHNGSQTRENGILPQKLLAVSTSSPSPNNTKKRIKQALEDAEQQSSKSKRVRIASVD